LIENRDVLERVTDLTGAGDTLAGACLASMLAGNPIEESVRAGMAAGDGSPEIAPDPSRITPPNAATTTECRHRRADVRRPVADSNAERAYARRVDCHCYAPNTATE
jgi:hypothetical protein